MDCPDFSDESDCHKIKMEKSYMKTTAPLAFDPDEGRFSGSKDFEVET